MSGIYIALGANLSNKKTSFIKALESLETAGARVLKVSGLWQSPSWPPGLNHPDYLNAVAEISFKGSPEALLDILQDIEAKMGRERTIRNAPRPLDLDILDFRGLIYKSKCLTLPHPRMLSRGFVLFPLQQIAPDWKAPSPSSADSSSAGANHIGQFTARLSLVDVAPMEYRGKFWRDAN